MSKSEIVDLIETMDRIFQGTPGNESSYSEGTSDFYNPIAAGMTFQRLKDYFAELVDEMNYSWQKSFYGSKRYAVRNDVVTAKIAFCGACDADKKRKCNSRNYEYHCDDYCKITEESIDAKKPKI